MHQEWTNIDVTFLTKIGIIPRGRSLRACRIYCKRHGVKFPGAKFLKDNEEILKLYESRYDKKETQMKESSNLKEIEITKIRENPNNPRTRIDSVEDLKASIRVSGLLQPIAVRWKDGCYEVVAGSRRYRACREIGLKTIPCNVLPQIGDDMAYELATAENIVRENMTAVDEANAVAKLFAQGKTRTEIGAMFGKSARWAEGRRKIVELGDKAMQLLAAGKINFGHAEVLTMCNPEDVNKWLDKATWSTPESLKNSIMNEKPLLERAPFDAKKVCKNCEKRSDEQKDLFGDIQCCYCLDRECFEAHVKKEAEYWRKKFLKDGLEEVPEDDRMDAENEWNGYVSTSTEDEDETEFVKDSIAEGKKPMFWVNEKTAEWGHVFRHEGYGNEDDNDEAEADLEHNEDPDSWDWQMNHMDYKRREKIRRAASEEEKRIVGDKLKGVFGNISITAKAFILSILNRVFENENGEQETYLKHQYDASANFLDEVADHIVNWYNGVDDDIREFLEMDSREEFERNANPLIGEDDEEETNKKGED